MDPKRCIIIRLDCFDNGHCTFVCNGVAYPDMTETLLTGM